MGHWWEMEVMECREITIPGGVESLNFGLGKENGNGYCARRQYVRRWKVYELLHLNAFGGDAC